MLGPRSFPSAIGDHDVVRSLGEGGMGHVFEVRSRTTGASYAAKLLKATRPVARERFRREAELLARCDRHPGIVRVHSFGELDDGTLYMIMDLALGEGLDRILEREGPLPPRRAAELGRDIARALGYAHAVGVFHRDVKPSNVIVDPSRGPRLTDFGIATACDLERLTATGTLVGTPLYVAPEQARGSEDVGPRADVFSLGAVIFDALAGGPPLGAAENMSDVLRELTSTDALPDVRKVAPSCPAALAAIVARALEKDPARRHADGAELARDLDRFLAGGKAAWTLPERRLVVGIAVVAVAAGLLASGLRRWRADAAPVSLAHGRELLALGRLEGLEDVAAALVSTSPPGARRAEALELLGDVRLARGDPANARAVYDLALEAAPRPELKMKRGCAAARAGDDVTALAALAELAPDLSRLSADRRANARLADFADPLYRRALARNDEADLEAAWRLGPPPAALARAVAGRWLERLDATADALGAAYTKNQTEERLLLACRPLGYLARVREADPTCEPDVVWRFFETLWYMVRTARNVTNLPRLARAYLDALPGEPFLFFLLSHASERSEAIKFCEEGIDRLRPIRPGSPPMIERTAYYLGESLARQRGMAALPADQERSRRVARITGVDSDFWLLVAEHADSGGDPRGALDALGHVSPTIANEPVPRQEHVARLRSFACLRLDRAGEVAAALASCPADGRVKIRADLVNQCRLWEGQAKNTGMRDHLRTAGETLLLLDQPRSAESVLATMRELGDPGADELARLIEAASRPK